MNEATQGLSLDGLSPDQVSQLEATAKKMRDRNKKWSAWSASQASKPGSPVSRFAADYCVIGDRMVSAKVDLWSMWCEWCHQNKHELRGKGSFFHMLRKDFPHLREAKFQYGKGRVSVLVGISIASHVAPDWIYVPREGEWPEVS